MARNISSISFGPCWASQGMGFCSARILLTIGLSFASDPRKEGANSRRPATEEASKCSLTVKFTVKTKQRIFRAARLTIFRQEFLRRSALERDVLSETGVFLSAVRECGTRSVQSSVLRLYELPEQ